MKKQIGETTYTCDYCGEKFYDEDECDDHELECGVNHYLATGKLKLFDEEKEPIPEVGDRLCVPENIFYAWWENCLAYGALFNWYNRTCLGLEECVFDGEGACYWSGVNEEWEYLDNKVVSAELVNGIFADQLCKVSRLTGEMREEQVAPADEVCKGEALTMPEKKREKWVLDNPLGDEIVILSLTEEQANLLVYLKCEGWLGEADVRAYNEPKIIII